MLKLAIEIDDHHPIEHEVLGDVTRIGRSHDNDFRIRNSYVSAFHAEVVRLPSGEYEIVDLGSFNGTYVNGSRVERSLITPGDRVDIGTLKGRVLGTVPNGASTREKKDKSGPVVAPLKAPTPGERSAPVNGSSKKARTGPQTPAAKERKSEAPASPELIHLRSRITGLEGEKNRLETSLAEVRKEGSRLEKEVQMLSAAVSQVAKSPSPSPSDEQKRLRAEMEGLAKREAEWRKKAVENAAAAKRLEKAETELAEARAFILQEQQTLGDLRARLSAESAHRTEAPDAEAMLRAELAEAQSRAAAAEASVRELSDQLSALQAAQSHGDAKTAAQLQEISELKDRLARQEMLSRGSAEIQERDAAETKARLKAVESDLAATQGTANRQKAELAARDESLEALESQLQDSASRLRELLSSKSRQEEDADSKIAQLHARISELKLEIEEARTQMEQFRAEAEEAKKQQSKLTLAESIAVRNLAEARQTGAETLNQLEELQVRFDRTESERLQAETELAAIRPRLTELENLSCSAGSNTDNLLAEVTSQMTDLQNRLDESESARNRAETALAEARARIAQLKSEFRTQSPVGAG